MSATEALGFLTPRRDRVRPGSAEDPDQEGWMVSYADLITLLFIFFALVVSISVVSKAKFELLTQQFNHASSTSLLELQKHMDEEIRSAGLGQTVQTRITEEGLQIVFNEAVLFGSAEAVVSRNGLEVMGRFSKLLRGIDREFHIAIEGHTDDRPIHTTQFQNNWALSASRSVSVLDLLAASGVDEKKLMVRAYADTRPVDAHADTNSKDAHVDTHSKDVTELARNRRVTLLIF